MLKELFNEIKGLKGKHIYEIRTINGVPFESIMNICEEYNVCERVQVESDEYFSLIYVGIEKSRKNKKEFINKVNEVKGLISIR